MLVPTFYIKNKIIIIIIINKIKIKALDSWRDGNKGRKLERKRVP